MKDTLWTKRLLALPFRLRAPPLSRDVILLYHAVGGGPSAMSVDSFQRQMEWLAAATNVISPDQMLGPRRSQAWRVAITFDDGYDSVFQNAFPIMRALGLTGSVYINTGRMGSGIKLASDPALGHYAGEHFMDWSSIQQLARAGWTIGSHGVEHVDLTSVTEARMTHELRASKKEIETRLGCTCEHFAFTWGHFSHREQMAVRDAGYRTAASATHGALNGRDDRYALPRVDISRQYNLSDLKAIVRGDWDFMGVIQSFRARLHGRA